MAAKSMNAVQYSGYGGGAHALKHVEVPIPKPKDDEVLLKVEATSLNQIDLKIQKGAMRPIFPRKFPFIPGSDVAGEVVQAGAKVTRFKVGDKVVSRVAAVSGGALAEYVVAKENQTVTRPRQVSAADGAALPIAALTAHQAIAELANIKLDGTGDKKNVLIIAASGGVGHYAVQLAKLGNTHVTATCGARNLDLVKSLGADEVIDYKTPDGAALKSPSGKKYDYIINCGPVSPWFSLDPNLSRTGKVIDLNPGITTAWTISLKKLTFSKKQLVFLIFTLKIENFDYVVNLVKEGKLKTVIDSKYSLSKAEDGWAKIMDGHATGKIIIEP